MGDREEKAVALVREFLQSKVELPFSSAAGSQLMELSNKPMETVNVDQLVKLVQMDPGLTSKVLQLANSVYFSGVKKIVSLRRALVQIGLEEAIIFIQMVFYRSALPEFPALRGHFSDEDYWAHSWATAIAAKILGHPKTGVSLLPGELYIAGLLHGIGKMVLAVTRPEELLHTMQNCKEFQQPLEAAELDVFGTTNTDVACELLSIWQLPENICTAIKFMHHPALAPEESQEFSGVLQLAYYIANTSGVGNIEDEFCFDVNNTWVAKDASIALSEEALRGEFVEDIHKVLREKKDPFAEQNSEEKKDEAVEEGEGAAPVSQIELAKQTSQSEPSSNLLHRLFAWLRGVFS